LRLRSPRALPGVAGRLPLTPSGINLGFRQEPIIDLRPGREAARFGQIVGPNGDQLVPGVRIFARRIGR
jgi:hypothetical protein